MAYSARMLAQMAVRASANVIALDYFGDRDLRALCPSHSLRRDYADKAYHPAALAAVAEHIAADAVVYGAGFENHPAAVERLARTHQILGNLPQTLQQVRDPLRLQSVLLEGGFVCPATQLAPSGSLPKIDAMDADVNRWLWKPLRGGGGTHVRWAQAHHPAPRAGVWQAFVDGTVGSFAFVANGHDAHVIGLTEQLIGQPAFGAHDFRWCGNLTPPRVPTSDLAALAREANALAQWLTERFALRGINGVDFVWRDGRIWVLEINPRPSASLELFDGINDPAWFDWHVRGCLGEALPMTSLEPPHRERTQARGKAIVFAQRDCITGDTADWHTHDLRDIPHSHEPIQRGQPICTALAHADSADDCLNQLRAKADLVREWLKPI